MAKRFRNVRPWLSRDQVPLRRFVQIAEAKDRKVRIFLGFGIGDLGFLIVSRSKDKF